VGALAALLVAAAWFRSAGFARRSEARVAEECYAAAAWAVQAGDLDGVREVVRRAQDYDTATYRGHLILARAYAQRAWYSEAEAEMRQALDQGFDPEAPAVTSTDHVCQGLYRMFLERPPDLRRIEEHFARAVELDPSQPGALVLLYQIRLSLRDREGAREALAAYLGTLRTGDPALPLVEALLAELEGRLDQAVEKLERVAAAPGSTPQDLRTLRLHRALGRLYLRRLDLDDAERELRQAVEDFPVDASSWLNLSLVSYERSLRSSSFAEAQEHLVRAAADARRGVEEQPLRHDGLVIRAACALKAVDHHLGFGVAVPDAAWAEAEARIEEVRAADLDSSSLTELESGLLYLEGMRADNEGETGGAIAAWMESVELDPDNLRAHVRLAQSMYFAQSYREMLDHLLDAADTWRKYAGEGAWEGEPWERKRWDRWWWPAIQVWTFGAAAHLGEEEIALDARRLVDEELESGHQVNVEELLTYAEFLATSPTPSLVDCDRALEIIEKHDLRERLADNPQGRADLQAIDAACGG